MIGQTIAKRRHALGVSNHYKRLVDTWDRGASDPIIADPDLRDVIVEKSNILPPRARPTLFAALRPTSTSPGHRRCHEPDRGWIRRRRRGVLALPADPGSQRRCECRPAGHRLHRRDRQDQRSGSGHKDLRLGVQTALLQMLQGTVTTVPPQGGWEHPAQPGITFDTSQVLFICDRPFVGLEDIIAKRLGRGGFGFGQTAQTSQVAEGY